jgi:hypothetical protein
MAQNIPQNVCRSPAVGWIDVRMKEEDSQFIMKVERRFREGRAVRCTEGERSERSHTKKKKLKGRTKHGNKTKRCNRLTKRSSFPGGVNLSLSLLTFSSSFLPAFPFPCLYVLRPIHMQLKKETLANV